MGSSDGSTRVEGGGGCWSDDIMWCEGDETILGFENEEQLVMSMSG